LISDELPHFKIQWADDGLRIGQGQIPMNIYSNPMGKRNEVNKNRSDTYPKSSDNAWAQNHQALEL
jgi:hypothetical protein